MCVNSDDLGGEARTLGPIVRWVEGVGLGSLGVEYSGRMSAAYL